MFEPKLAAVAPEKEQTANQDSLDPRALSSVLISVKMIQSQEEPSYKDPHERLLELMHATPVRALLDSASILAGRQGIPAHEALKQVILHLQEIDKLWNQVLIKEGLARLSSQFH
jgi:hypothetical protein